jgi:tetratricopeptide (TPR) repeat protein
MLLLDVWPLGRLSLAKYSFARTARRLILEKLPYFLLSAIAGVLAVTLQSSDHATPDLLQLSVLDRVATAILGLTRYLGMAIYPREQSILYPYQFDPPMAAVIASALLLTLISAVLIRAGRRRPYLAVGWLWFVIAMLPVIGLIQAGNQAIADRYTYLPYIGLSIAAIWWIADIVESAPASQRRAVRGIAVTFGCAAVIGCIVQTHRYLPAWASTASLFSHAAEVNVVPDWNIEYHLAEGWVEAGRPDLAIEHYELTIAQRPDHVGAQNNLGNLLAPHFPELALPHYQIAVRADPDDATVHYDYGLCLDALHRPVEAAGQFRRVLQLQPDFPGARAALQRVNRQR